MALGQSILNALREVRGAKLTAAELCARLGLTAGDTGQPWQNVCNVIGECVRLEERGLIQTTADCRHVIPIPAEADHG